jgi:hypothetical protein
MHYGLSTGFRLRSPGCGAAGLTLEGRAQKGRHVIYWALETPRGNPYDFECLDGYS